MIDLGKKGDLKRILMILIVGLLLFGVFAAVLGLAETAEEEKARLEAELFQLESQLQEIDGGKWVNVSTTSDPCKIDYIKYFNYKCDGSIGYSADCISNSCGSMPDEAVRIKSRILAIKNQLKILGEK